VPDAAERFLIVGARLCAVLVVAIQPFVIATLAIATVMAIFRGSFAVGLTRFEVLLTTTLGLGVFAATLGTVVGVGAALFTLEIATPTLRRTVKALVGALHAVPAVGFGVAAAGVLLFSAKAPVPGSTLLFAAFVLSIMIASVVFVQMRRELSQLPPGVRTAAAAAGADAMQSTLLAVLPALRRRIMGIWWSSLALGLGEATAMQVIFAAAFAKAGGHAPTMLGTIASTLLQAGAAERGAALVGLARIASGQHWPTDVLGGLMLGVAWLTICLAVARMVGRRSPVT
jgi:ABC-type phosphate transport system permease subunit